MRGTMDDDMRSQVSDQGTTTAFFGSLETQSISAKTTSDDNEVTGDTVTIGTKKLPKLNWVRHNYKGDNHDNRRLVEHRERNCMCETCFLEMNKLPPPDPVRVKMAMRKKKLDDREIKRAKKKAKRELKEGKQACIRNFFRY